MARLAVEGVRAQIEPLARLLREPPALGAAWAMPDYMRRSDSIKAADNAVRDLKPAPLGSGFFLHDSMTVTWFASPNAASLAEILVSYQAPNGGWSKRIAFTRPRATAEAFTSQGNRLWLSTFDNGSTTEQLRFLAARLSEKPDATLRASYQRGLNYVLNAQYPNGCWPQIYPLAGSYHDAVTFNDDVIVNVMRVLQTASKDTINVPAELRSRINSALKGGVDCIIMTQVMVAGARTVWGAQHDPLTLAPVKARAYEHASLSGRESAAIIDFLMSLENPSAEVVRAIYAGADWLSKNALYGHTYVPRQELVAKEGAGPLWARFYEIGTNKPIFSDRDGIVRYSLSEIGEERRRGYLWYTDEPATTLRRFERWQKRHPLPGMN
jgi:PelA/Pel-15E family pectate lyase